MAVPTHAAKADTFDIRVEEGFVRSSKEFILQDVKGIDTTWSYESDPNYYKVLGKSKIVDDMAPGEYAYAGFDKLNRTIGMKAKITQEDFQKSRKSPYLPLDEDAKKNLPVFNDDSNRLANFWLPNGDTSSDYFWNRVRLLPESLGGAPKRYNMFTGTITSNVGNGGGKPGGMSYAESRMREWFNDHEDGWILYSAVPIYKGTEPIPRAVLVDVLSSDGELDERVLVYNTAYNYSIDYKTGTFKDDDAEPPTDKKEDDRKKTLLIIVGMIVALVGGEKTKKKEGR